MPQMAKTMCNDKDNDNNKLLKFKKILHDFRDKTIKLEKTSFIQYISIRVIVWLIAFLLINNFCTKVYALTLHHILCLFILLIALLVLYIVDLKQKIYHDRIKSIKYLDKVAKSFYKSIEKCDEKFASIEERLKNNE